MFIPDLGSYFYSIPDLGVRIQQEQKEEVENKLVLPFFGGHKFRKIENEMCNQMFWPIDKVKYF